MKVSHLRGLFLNSSSLFGNAIVGAGINFLQSILVTRALGPSDFGLWAIIAAAPSFVQMLLGFRTTEALNRALIQDVQAGGKLPPSACISAGLGADLVSRLVAFLIVALGSPWLVQNFTDGRVSPLLFSLYGLVILSGFADASISAVLRHGERYLQLSVLSTIASFLTLIGVAGCYFLGAPINLNVLVWIYVVAYLLRFILIIAILRKVIQELYHASLRSIMPHQWIRYRKELKDFWQYMRFSFVSSSLTSIFKSCDILLLSLFSVPHEVGLYKLAKSLAALIGAFGNSMSTVEFQELARHVSTHDGEIPWSRVRRITLVLMPLVILGILAGNLLAEPVITAIFGVAYTSAASSFCILLVSTGITITLFWAHPLSLVLRRFRSNLHVVSVCGVLSVVLITVLSPSLGALGASIGVGIGMAGSSLGYLWACLNYERQRVAAKS